MLLKLDLKQCFLELLVAVPIVCVGEYQGGKIGVLAMLRLESYVA